MPGEDSDHTLLLLCAALGLPSGRTLLRLQRLHKAMDGSSRDLVDGLLAGQFTLPGVGPAALTRLLSSLTLAEALAAESLLAGPPLESPAACLDWLRLHFGGLDHERFVGIYLNAAHRVLGMEDLFYGTLDSAAVYPRVVAERALGLGAAAVIVAHNHPSGRLKPSSADVRITERLRAGLALLDIRLLDHLIVGDGTYTSLSEQGLC